ncbi:hypothetical protein CLOSTHATH_00330 [Hungatella hathewayi DSM 13479]|uniref:Uncharacterized protein n=1 Tax=Hungatella hathewayi DSM 13479 TaxID=566550 RepID=D3A9Q9_9FIRM|nr:hypothetical protein CLOSTHATH_00330 [Hungatella hathewayi DSM 13479]
MDQSEGRPGRHREYRQAILDKYSYFIISLREMPSSFREF